MADISTITLLDGNTYNLKDTTARARPIVYMSTTSPSQNVQAGDLWFIIEEDAVEEESNE